ncbi:PilW family protein [Massilia antarctica]|uniref:PilW family protein n=1 Tax=Massilia antarctica TaxID=2765360 RepID=UPI0006BC2F5A|nr:PilW family protein [Massilia sp. H27-R4]MCY0912354.1 PilW family protein [Massilia sp. H27-R4]CUI03476.1 Type IV fimbrial biogenesis protein PilW [Janthinobacterium sp. CG23_2]CUU27262.1 Type IV fimbrial biogenesis protein PilW [Janthinobacterium sp. CG23_2]
MTIRPTTSRALAPSRQQGIGLVEVLVAMTVGLVLLGGVGYMFVGSKQMNTAQTDVVRLQESTRNALDVLGTALRQAGYRLNVDEDGIVGEPIAGMADGDSDILILRHDPSWVVDATPSPAIPNRLLGKERNCEGTEIVSNNAVDPAKIDSQINTNLIVYQFKVVNGKLKCYADDSATPAGPGVVVADNVERMKITYGIGDGKEAVTSYVASPTSDQFKKVSVVRVSLLLRGPSKGVTVGTQTVKFNGADVVTTDGQLRRVVTSTFNVRNRARS